MSKIGVWGDVFLDVYYRGTSWRLSPEAPVPVVELNSVTNHAGGAANVCLNLASLGSEAVLFGQIGDDQEGIILRDILKRNNIDVSLLSIIDDFDTITKTRIFSNDSYTLRLDREDKKPLSELEENRILNRFESRIKEFDIIIISDYLKGFVGARLIRSILKLAWANNIKVLADPKGDDILKYAGVHILTPNCKESRVLSKKDYLDEAAFYLGKYVDSILITKAAEGMSFYDDSGKYDFQATNKHIRSTVGAGDAVISSLAHFLSIGYPILDSLEMTNEIVGNALNQSGTVVAKHI